MLASISQVILRKNAQLLNTVKKIIRLFPSHAKISLLSRISSCPINNTMLFFSQSNLLFFQAQVLQVGDVSAEVNLEKNSIRFFSIQILCKLSFIRCFYILQKTYGFQKIPGIEIVSVVRVKLTSLFDVHLYTMFHSSCHAWKKNQVCLNAVTDH